MIHGHLSVDTWNHENNLSAPSDEKTKILESRSPTKLRGELSPLPKLDTDARSRQRTKRSTKKTISEFKSFGAGTNELLCCRFDQEDNLIAAGTSDGLINVFSLNSTGTPLQTLNGAETAGIPITCMRWRPYTSTSKSRQILVTGCGDGNITHWHVPSGKLLHRIIEKDNQVLCLDYDKEGSSFATAGKDKIVRVYDENTKSLKTELSGGFWQYPGHSNRVFALKFHPEDSNILLSAGWDSVVYFWDIRDKKSFASIFGPAVSGDSIDIKGNSLLTGSWRNKDQLELWDYGSRKKIQTIDWEYGSNIETAYVYACQFSKKNDEDIIAGCSNLNEVKIFDRTNNYKEYGKISNVEKGVFSVDFSNNLDTFSFCGGDGRVHIGQLSSA